MQPHYTPPIIGFFWPCFNHGTQLNHWVTWLCTPYKLIFKTYRLSYLMMPLNVYKYLSILFSKYVFPRTPLGSPLDSSHHWLFFSLWKLSFHVVPFLKKFILTLLHSSLSICPFFSLYPVIEGHSHSHSAPVHWLI